MKREEKRLKRDKRLKKRIYRIGMIECSSVRRFARADGAIAKLYFSRDSNYHLNKESFYLDDGRNKL